MLHLYYHYYLYKKYTITYIQLPTAATLTIDDVTKMIKHLIIILILLSIICDFFSLSLLVIFDEKLSWHVYYTLIFFHHKKNLYLNLHWFFSPSIGGTFLWHNNYTHQTERVSHCFALKRQLKTWAPEPTYRRCAHVARHEPRFDAQFAVLSWWLLRLLLCDMGFFFHSVSL